SFVNYFIGSNADLLIVFCSSLFHDHYQVCCYEFAMTRANNSFTFDIEGFRDVTASVLEWPLSVIRLKSDEKSNLIEAADHILTTWKNYSDTSANIKAFTDKTPHNTVTPI